MRTRFLPLTPALSLGERENRSPLSGWSNSLGVRVARRWITQRTAPVRATFDLRKMRDACSLSPGERARVRGNERPPTIKPGRILQAQLDRLPESKLAITSRPKPVDGGGARSRKGRQFQIAAQ